MAHRILPPAGRTHKAPDPFTMGDSELEAWLNDLPDDVEARDAWTDAAEAARLRELEEIERVGNDFGDGINPW